MSHKERRLHYMQWSDVVNIGKKAYDELPHLIQPSSTDIALAQLYAYYEYNESKKQSLWFRLKKLFVSFRKWKIDCEHEWRIYGTRYYEEGFTRIGSTRSNLICDKCGLHKSVDRSNYKIIYEKPYPPNIFSSDDTIVKIIDHER